MEKIHSRELQIDTKIKQSSYNMLMGIVVVIALCAAMFFLYNQNSSHKKIPFFVMIIFGGSCLLFFKIALDYIRSYFDPKKFLIAFNQSDIILPFNHLIKRPKEENNYYLSLSPGKDFKRLEMVKELKTIPKRGRSASRNSTEIQWIHYIEFELKEEIPPEFIELRKKIATQQGYQGSPILFKKNIIRYMLSGNLLKTKVIAKELIRRGLFSGKFLERKFDVSDNRSPEELIDEVRNLYQTGSSLDAIGFLNYLEQSSFITADQKDILIKEIEEYNGTLEMRKTMQARMKARKQNKKR